GRCAAGRGPAAGDRDTPRTGHRELPYGRVADGGAGAAAVARGGVGAVAQAARRRQPQRPAQAGAPAARGRVASRALPAPLSRKRGLLAIAGAEGYAGPVVRWRWPP